ncbi:alpha/beta fold hydrolase [Loktanella agnita]|uniref:alpha/beta fold hydrolase n=1 Tax=Loktanella agnita TaxID=287097 RepID=UPI0039872A1B
MWYVITLCVILVIAAPRLLEMIRPTIGPKQRQNAEGDFAQLSQGVTHFRWVGPVRGPVAVIIHGLTTPLVAMDGIAEGLGGMGYRVLTYDLYGRGLSDAPTGAQNRVFFLQQLTDLLAHQGIRGDITLAGYSMGGSIATAFAAENPHRITRVVLFAPAGVKTTEGGFARFCRMMPIVGDWVHGLFARKRILEAIPKSTARPEVNRVLVAQRNELRRKGFLPAILSSRRGMLSEKLEKDHRMLQHEDVPVIAIWAEKDATISIKSKDILAKWNRAARQEVVKGATHALPYTHSAEALDALRHALR